MYPHCWSHLCGNMYSLITGDSGHKRLSLCLLHLFQKSVARIFATVCSHRLPTETTGAQEYIWGDEAILWQQGLNITLKEVLREKLVYCRVIASNGRKPERGLRAFLCLSPFLILIIFPSQSRFSYLSVKWFSVVCNGILCFGRRVHFSKRLWSCFN